MKTLKKVLTQILLASILVVAFAVPVLAVADIPIFDGKMLVESNGRWSCYNPNNLTATTLHYEDAIEPAVSSWNTKTNFNFIEYDAFDPVSIDIYYVIGDYGNTENWHAITYFYDSSDDLMNPDGMEPYGDWDYVIIKMNHNTLRNFTELKKLQCVSAHEMGHALGLAHNAEDKTKLMYPNLDNYEDEDIYKPDPAEADMVDSIYQES